MSKANNAASPPGERPKGVRISLKTIVRRVVFSKSLVIFLMLALQALALLLPVFQLSTVSLLSGLVILAIINSNEHPDFKIAWMLPVAIAPVFGALLFLFLKIQPGTIFIRQRSKKLDRTAVNTSCQPVDGVGRYLYRMSYPTYNDTKTTYFPLGELMFEQMMEQIRAAEEFIFLEFFIVAEGLMWTAVTDLLIEKAKQGVEVRFMWDALGSLGRLPHGEKERLERAGIQCKIFVPLRPVLSMLQNNRDHRKILVVDGKVGFTGGINIADEYINIALPHHWKDTGVMLEGGGVNTLTLLFLRTWILHDPNPQKEHIFRYVRDHKAQPDGHVVPFGDSPFDGEDIAKRVYLDIINRAERYVHIMTPYLIIDSELSGALQFAAKRGVDVALMLPYISDSWFSNTVGRTYYRELIEAGVKLYEYEPGMMHSKTFVADDARAVVGTINIDYRSLFLHLECGCYLLGSSSVAAVEQDFQACLKQCRQIGLDGIVVHSLPRRIIARVLRLFAPLL